MKFAFALTLSLLASFASSQCWGEETKPAKAKAFEVKVTGKGPPMIFIPGLACSSEVWDDAVKHFSPKYECHVLTLAGFAGVKPVEGPFLDTMRDGIAAYIREKKLAKPVIVGHSIGGFLCYMLALAEPELVGPLVPVDGMPCLAALMNPQVTDKEAKQMAKRMLQQSATTREQYLKQQAATLANWIEDKPLRERTAKWGADSDQKTVGAAMADMIGRDLRSEVSKIKPRMLIVTAPVAFFNVTKEEARNRYETQVKAIPNGKVVYAEKSKHFVMYDEPEWLWKQIDEFLASK
ncbi:alpha/beta hydrolase [soil metagenome]